MKRKMKTSDDLEWSSRDKLFTIFFAGVATSSGKDWKNIRSFSLRVLRDFGFGKRSLQSRVKEEVELFIQEVEKNVNKPFDIRHTLQISVANIICSVVFGKRFEYDDKDFIQQIDDMDEELGLANNVGALNFFPFLHYLPGDFFNIKRMKQLIENELQRYQTHVDAHERNLNTEEEPRDYIDALLIAKRSSDWLTG